MKPTHAKIVKLLQGGCFLANRHSGYRTAYVTHIDDKKWTSRMDVRIKTIHDMIEAGILDRQWALTEAYKH